MKRMRGNCEPSAVLVFIVGFLVCYLRRLKIDRTQGNSNICWDNDKKVYTISYSGLEHSKLYTIDISGFNDVAGNVMVADNTHSFTTIAAPTYTVIGTITGSDAPGGLAATVQLKQNGANVGSPVTAGTNGSYTIAGVPAGTGYTVEASTSGYVTATTAAFSVTNVNATGKDLVLQKAGKPLPDHALQEV